MTPAIFCETAEKHHSCLPFPYNEIATTYGTAVLHAVADFFGGTTVYIPTKAGMLKECIIEAIRQDYTGYNIKELARRYEISESFIRRIVKKNS